MPEVQLQYCMITIGHISGIYNFRVSQFVQNVIQPLVTIFINFRRIVYIALYPGRNRTSCTLAIFPSRPW